MIIDFDYEKFSTPNQAKLLKAVVTHGGVRPAARELGINPKNIYEAYRSVRKRAAVSGGVEFKGMAPVPEPFLLKGESLLHNKRTGEDLLVWRKTKIDDAARWEMIQEAIQSACKDVKRLKAIPKPANISGELCNVAIVTDLHVGMKAWKPETGGNWDLKIAEKTAVTTFANLFSRAPKAKTCVLVNLGDFLHYDGLTPVTPTSGHVLDADGRYPKMAEVAVSILRQLIDMALMTHEKVVVVIAEGNHDMSSCVWLRMLIKAMYADDPRVEVIESYQPYYAYKFGENMFAFHHSHLTPMEKLDRVFATMFREMWGKTSHHFGFTGDKHHLKVIDQFGMMIEQVPTLATMDAYAARHGYAAARRASVITYHERGGEVTRTTADPEMLV